MIAKEVIPTQLGLSVTLYLTSFIASFISVDIPQVRT